MSNTKIYLALGSNMGNRGLNIDKAVSAISELCPIDQKAPTYLTRPWGLEEQPTFLNTVVSCETELSSCELLKKLKEIERKLGRRAGRKWGPRVIDIDILLFGRRVIKTPQLEVPHKYLTARDFFLQPLLELAPKLIHPGTGVPLESYTNNLTEHTIIACLQ